MRESKIESTVVDYAISKGWLPLKFTSSTGGVPDRIFIRDGNTIYVEFKSSTGNTRPLQDWHHREFARHGVLVNVINDIDEGKQFFDAYEG